MLEKILFLIHMFFLFIWGITLITAFIQCHKIKYMKNVTNPEVQIGQMIQLVKWVLNPSSFLVLVSGIFMIENLGLVHSHKPLYILLMEIGGAGLICCSIIGLTYQSRKLKQCVKAKFELAQHTIAKLTAGLGAMSGGTAVLAVIVLLIAYSKVS